ncbi:MAG: Plug domain-containing protein [Flavobacteriales bacterium]|nr:Plug domain-containing protein [Flavobacteriales bacterium]MCB9196752.1 Plug domain-containing protein [Flavobacteriales bacterium]
MNLRLIILSSLFVSAASAGIAQTDTTAVEDTTANSIPLFIINDDGGDDNANQVQNVSGLLQSSRDVYAKQVGFNFSFARFRMRGYDADANVVLMNGMPMNDPESGMAIWAYWGGLNDITRYPEIQTGISSSQSTFGGILGYTNMNLNAGSKQPGTRVSYAATNRTYRHRLMVTHNTGWMKGGWALSMSLSGRYSKEGYVDGTFYRGYSYFVGVEKKLSEKHSMNLAYFAAPTIQGRQGIAVQEAYTLTGNNFYNPYWGYQTDPETGEQVKRNARVRNNFVNYLILSDEYKINAKSNIKSTLYYQFGRSGNTNLNWNNTSDPRPDYYRYLPSYSYNGGYDETGDLYTDLWTSNDPSTTQLDFDHMYFANSKNMYTVDNANGSGESYTGNRSKYIIEDYRQDPTRLGIYSVYNNQIKDNMRLTAGVSAYNYKSENFREIKDLLGGDFWLDVDQFAERDFDDPEVAMNDLSTPNKIVKVGDRYSYDYDMHVQYAEMFSNLDFKVGKSIDGYAGLSLSGTQFWRHGNLQNGKFPDNSLGDSEKQKFLNYGVKGGLIYKISGRHIVNLNVLHQTKAPLSRNAYISPRTRDQVVDGLTSSEITSGDINYLVRYPKLKARATYFYTMANNLTWSRSFYHDEYRNFVNYMMTGVNKLYQGVEIGVEGNVTSTITASAAFTKGLYIYNSRPSATITVDNSLEELASDKVVYLKNYKIGNGPQTAATIGIKYSSPKYWFVGVNANYVTDIYLDPNPDRRTLEALDGYVDTDPQVAEILAPTKLDGGFMLNAFAGWSYRIKSGDYLRINVNVNNVLNNTSFVSGGYEQLRYDPTQIDKFPAKLGYTYGLSYFAMITYIF